MAFKIQIMWPATFTTVKMGSRWWWGWLWFFLQSLESRQVLLMTWNCPPQGHLCRLMATQERLAVCIRVCSGASLPAWLLLWHLSGMSHLSGVDTEGVWLCGILAFKKVVSEEGGSGTQWKEHRPLVHSLLLPTLAVWPFLSFVSSSVIQSWYLLLKILA